MLAVDSNVLAYLLLDAAQTSAARALLERDSDWRSESFVLVELTNVLATGMRVGRFDVARAQEALALGQRLMESRLHAVDHHDALALAHRHRVSAYDARYLGVAAMLGVRLVTEDAKLRHAAPELTQSIGEALAAA
ncbi:MAG: type II toxin-antitoxin system VapC family toxin [Burkholderiales bacterium]|nr:type II toxin-antitoxin system VapC family toxin [Burkholderiales bacterium]